MSRVRHVAAGQSVQHGDLALHGAVAVRPRVRRRAAQHQPAPVDAQSTTTFCEPPASGATSVTSEPMPCSRTQALTAATAASSSVPVTPGTIGSGMVRANVSRSAEAVRPVRVPPPGWCRTAVRATTMPGCSSTTRPMIAASAPSGRDRMAASTASLCAGSTKATILPSLATCNGSRPRKPHAEATVSGTGMACSSSSTPTPAARAISTVAATSPPRVGSRSA